jgi:hypothetical protein
VAASIEAVQAGSGDPSPTNVRPITGWTGANITVSPTLDAGDGTTYTVTFPTEAGTVYGGTLNVLTGELTVERAMIVIDGTGSTYAVSSGGIPYITTNLAHLTIQGTLDMICDQYKAARTVVDERVRTSTATRVTIYDTSRFPDEATARASLTANPVHIVYPLATPIVYQLSPVQIAALSGYNAIFADCGPISVEYTQDTGAAIDAGDASTRGMIGETSGETASRSLAVGEYVTVGDKLYRVTRAVGSGETLVPGSNVTETTVGAELSRLAAMISQ